MNNIEAKISLWLGAFTLGYFLLYLTSFRSQANNPEPLGASFLFFLGSPLAIGAGLGGILTGLISVRKQWRMATAGIILSLIGIIGFAIKYYS
ncbi:hypothetical protein COY17_03060 [Candidatus Saccharibacteria bacterium CG_4_10_14_0_2_um_filter_52_9]|nr:MAG: hypothetical protein COY17_03060 [Candidatus Saccharibacteria bacterium CG_4_10_14_0_2_um_filter_52_9]